MRDSALKHRSFRAEYLRYGHVGEELMRDSALKPITTTAATTTTTTGRRRAHARQRFETPAPTPPPLALSRVGEELMRDSALKRGGSAQALPLKGKSEKSSCATAL